MRAVRVQRIGAGLSALSQALARVEIDLRSAAGGRAYRRFVIVGTARTGSTLLLNLLNASPHALSFGELFRGDGRIGWDTEPFQTYQSARLARLIEDDPLRFLAAEVFRKWPGEVRAVGFKIFYYHARTGRQAAVWDAIRDDPDIILIHIKRVNLLEQYLSLMVAHATNVWSVSNRPAAEPAPIVLDPPSCRRHFEEVRAYEHACEALFAGRDPETVTYEELVADRGAAMGRIYERLGLPIEPGEARIVKQRTRSLRHAIANYNELGDFFSGSEWEWLFHLPDTAVVPVRHA